MNDSPDRGRLTWRRRLPWALTLFVGIAALQPLGHFCRERGGAWWLLLAGFLVAWFAVAAWVGARELARERWRRQRADREHRRGGSRAGGDLDDQASAGGGR